MQLNVVIHKAEEGGYWAEVPSIPGCATQGESLKDVLTNLGEAIEGCLSVEIEKPEIIHLKIAKNLSSQPEPPLNSYENQHRNLAN